MIPDADSRSSGSPVAKHVPCRHPDATFLTPWIGFWLPHTGEHSSPRALGTEHAMRDRHAHTGASLCDMSHDTTVMCGIPQSRLPLDKSLVSPMRTFEKTMTNRLCFTFASAPQINLDETPHSDQTTACWHRSRYSAASLSRAVRLPGFHTVRTVKPSSQQTSLLRKWHGVHCVFCKLL